MVAYIRHSSLVVEYLRHEVRNLTAVGVAVVYCQYKDREIQSSQNMLAGLWRQLVDPEMDLPERVLSL